jgi:hypothetical protein
LKQSPKNIQETSKSPNQTATTLPILRILLALPILTENPFVLFFGIVLAK